MILAPLAQSANVIDLRTMLHLMPSDYQAAIQAAKLSGVLFGAGLGIGVSWLALVTFAFMARSK